MTDGLTYAGKKCCLDVDDQIASMLRTLWPSSRWPFRDRTWSEGFDSSTLRRNADPLLASPYPIPPAPGVNELVIPTGAARYASALLLFEHSTFLELAADVWAWAGNAQQTQDPEYLEDINLEGVWGAEANWRDLTITYNEKTLSWSMTALTPQLLLGGLWLVPLVDRRYFLTRMPRAVTFPSDEDKTWSTLFDDYATLAGMTINKPVSFASAYLVPDNDTFSAQGVGLGHAIDAAALSVGLRVIPANKGTELTLIAADDSRTLMDTNYVNSGSDTTAKHRQLGGYYPRAPKPKQVNLISPVLRNYYVCDGHEITTSAISESSVNEEVITVFTTCYAQYLLDEFQSASSTALTAMALKLKTDLADWAKWAHNGTFAAIANYSLTGHDDYWSIGFRGGRRINSQVRALPPNFYPPLQCSQAEAFFRHLDDGIICKLTENITACDSETLELGFGEVIPMLPDESGTLQERTKSDGTDMALDVYHAGFNAIEFNASGGDQFIQCKRVNCTPIVDVNYC